MKVQNMTSANGNKVANQFIISDGNVDIFQSYDTIIAKIEFGIDEIITLDVNAWDYSTTTGKYRNLFLNENKKETESKIKSGEYILADLNA